MLTFKKPMKVDVEYCTTIINNHGVSPTEQNDALFGLIYVEMRKTIKPKGNVGLFMFEKVARKVLKDNPLAPIKPHRCTTTWVKWIKRSSKYFCYLNRENITLR